MASGFGSFRSSNNRESGYGNIYLTTVVSQTVNQSARTVTIKVRSLVTYYRRTGGNWNPGTSNLFYTDVSGSQITATLDGGTATTGTRLGLKGNNQTLYVGSYYTIDTKTSGGTAYVAASNNAVAEKSVTYNYNNNGDAITKSWSASMNYSGTTFSLSGSVTTDSISAVHTAPSGLSVSNISTTYNTITAKSAVTSWGTGVGPNRLETLALTQPYTQGGLPQRYVQTTSSSQTATVTNSSTAANGGITIKGAGNYYAGTYATNGSLDARATSGVVYTPPAPLASITYTQSQGSTNVTVTPKITGGSSSNNNSNNVSTSYRYSTNGGSTWSAWTTISGTATAWTEKTGSAFTCNYGASVKIQAKQTYQSKDSAVKEVSFTATNGTAPSGGTVTVTGSTWNTVTLQASGANYGKPDGISTRNIIVGVTPDASSYSYKREVGLGAVTSGTGTVNNNSASGGSAQPFTLKGMLPVYAYLWVNNTVQSAFVEHKSTPYYLPPAPGQLSYTLDSQTAVSKTYTVSYTGVAANNVTDYTAADLTRTFRYSTDGGSTWTYVDNAAVKTLTAVSSFTITLAAQESVQVEAYHTYKNSNSDTSSVTIANSSAPIYLYGSVNGEATQVEKLYGSANGETVKIKKLYCSVNGVSRLVYEDLN